jgi:MarR family transcriptional regulator for hemolysin
MQPFDNNLFSVLHEVARLMRRRFDQHSRTYGMTRTKGLILLHIRRQPAMSQNEVAAIIEVEPITVARLVDHLEADGLVERRADPSDRRIHRLHLKPAAAPVVAKIESYRQQMLVELTEGLDPADWAAALKVLLHMKNKLTAQSAGSRPDAANGE